LPDLRPTPYDPPLEDAQLANLETKLGRAELFINARPRSTTTSLFLRHVGMGGPASAFAHVVQPRRNGAEAAAAVAAADQFRRLDVTILEC